MNAQLARLKSVSARIAALPPRPIRIRFNSKADMIHMLNEPELRPADLGSIDHLFGIPIVIDPDVPPRQYRLDFPVS